MKKALLVIDIQNDFVEGGALAVQGGKSIIPLTNRIMKEFDLVIASQDWHPSNHKSFASNNGKNLYDTIELNGILQIMWPTHCVQNTKGAEFCEEIDSSCFYKIFQKGMNPEVDSYSAFYDNASTQDTGLSTYLTREGVTDVYVLGLAADFCVKYTCLDAMKEGFKTHLYVEATKPVKPEEFEDCLVELQQNGVTLIRNSHD